MHMEIINRKDQTIYTLKMLGCFNPTFGSNMDKPKRWGKNVIKKLNPMVGFVHIWQRYKSCHWGGTFSKGTLMLI